MNMLNVFNIDNDDCIILTGNFTKYIRKNKHHKNSLNYLLEDFIDLIDGGGIKH